MIKIFATITWHKQETTTMHEKEMTTVTSGCEKTKSFTLHMQYWT